LTVSPVSATSPTPSPSESVWSGLGLYGALSIQSSRPSESESTSVLPQPQMPGSVLFGSSGHKSSDGSVVVVVVGANVVVVVGAKVVVGVDGIVVVGVGGNVVVGVGGNVVVVGGRVVVVVAGGSVVGVVHDGSSGQASQKVKIPASAP